MTTIITIFTPETLEGEVLETRCAELAAHALSRGVSSLKARIGGSFVELERHPDTVDVEPIGEDVEIVEIVEPEIVN